ncbi:hypothetical protein EV401DRAFT_1891791 [Pisolithus croceorrhizus]|nr:hypothetical protein EV401DRAFT_1891791 [Pisolithus croceorrhizus]
MSNVIIFVSIEWLHIIPSGVLSGMYQPPKVGSIETYLEDLECDAILVHQRCFPVSLPGVVVPPEAHVSTIPSPATAAARMACQKIVPLYPPIQLMSALSWSPATRTDRTCENEDLSPGTYSNPSPAGLHPMLGDLFIQKHSNGDMSVWLWNNTEWLSDISDGHVHPILGDYRLSIRAGSDPTWVTCKTCATYLGKERWRNKSAGSVWLVPSSDSRSN